MGKRGPLKTPKLIKQARGTYRNDQEYEMELAPISLMPSAPEQLNEFGKIEFETQIQGLIDHKIMAPCDLTAFIAYCEVWGIYRQLAEELKIEGRTITSDKGNILPNPKDSMARNYFILAHNLRGKFGLTPVDRVSLPNNIQKKEEDPIEQMIRLLNDDTRRG